MMDFIKKRLFLIMCVAIALGGGGLFALSLSMDAGNREKLTKIRSVVSGIKSLPVVSNDSLAYYEAQAESARRDAEEVARLARETSDRPLIYAGVFPELKRDDSSSRQYHYGQFARNYVALVRSLQDGMKAGDRPSQVEEENVRMSYTNTPARAPGRAPVRREPGGMDIGPGAGGFDGGPAGGFGGGPVGGFGGDSRRTGVTRTRADFQEEKLIDDLRRRRSEEIAVYAGVDAFCRYDYWGQDDVWGEDVGDTSAMQMNSWFTQIAAWIQEDVASTIRSTNGDSESVSGSPIKRLMGISFSTADSASRRTSSSSSRVRTERVVRRQDSSSLPAYVTSTKEQARRGGSSRSGRTGGSGVLMQGNMVEPWTGRASDDMLDVVHFEVAVVVDTTRITDFLNALRQAKYTIGEQDGRSVQSNKRNQIVVLEMNMEPVDIEAEQQAGYYYGAASVAELRVVCEYSFFRDGYRRHVPGAVKELLNPTSTVNTSGSRRNAGRSPATRRNAGRPPM